MGALSAWHWLILAVVVLLLFGYKKLPDAARSVGRSMRIFKSEVGSLREENNSASQSHRDEERPRPSTPPVIEGDVVRPSSSTEEPSRRTQE